MESADLVRFHQEINRLKDGRGRITTDLMAKYLSDVGDRELLTAEFEVELFQKMAAGWAAEERLNKGRFAEKDEEAELRLLDRIGTEAMDYILSANLHLVVADLSAYANMPGMDLNELFTFGTGRLAQAVQGWRWPSDARFSSYATKWIHMTMAGSIAHKGLRCQHIAEGSHLGGPDADSGSWLSGETQGGVGA